MRPSERRELRHALALSSAPEITTLFRFLQCLGDGITDQAAVETARRLRSARRRSRGSVRVAVDATSLAQGAVSTFFLGSLHHHGQKPLAWRHRSKGVVVADQDQRFLLSQIARSGPESDCGAMPAVVEASSEETRIGLMLVDAEFDSERNHTYIRRQPGPPGVISAMRETKAGAFGGCSPKCAERFRKGWTGAAL